MLHGKALTIFRQGTMTPGFRQRMVNWGSVWSADFPPWRVHLFPPRLLSKNEVGCAGLCVRWAEVLMTCTVI